MMDAHQIISMGLLWLLVAMFNLPAQADTTLYYPEAVSQDSRNEYFVSLLKLALKKGDSDETYQLTPYPDPLSQNRAIKMLSKGEHLSVAWSMTTSKREQMMRPIRIPLLKGLMGFRLFIIHGDEQQTFSAIKSSAHLKKLTAGQVLDWPDTRVLKANKVPVATPSSYSALFQMLHLGRIDYVPRAINEPWEEVKHLGDGEFSVETTLLLYYPTANYFFVAPGNKALAQTIERGLEKAIADGSFDELFYNHPINEHALNEVRLVKRRLIKLKNPLLPEKTPVDREELWWLPPQLPSVPNLQSN